MTLLQKLQNSYAAFLGFFFGTKIIPEETTQTEIFGSGKAYPTTEDSHTKILKDDPLVEINEKYDAPLQDEAPVLETVADVTVEDGKEKEAVKIKKGPYSEDEVDSIKSGN